METGTKITSAHVKVMLSHDYNHFEASMGLSNDNGLTTAEIDNARKDCQRLTLKAVEQYTRYKNVLSQNQRNEFNYDRLVSQVQAIEQKPESQRTAREKAAVKTLEDWNWSTRRRPYDFEDDFDMDDYQQNTADDDFDDPDPSQLPY